MFKKIFLLFWKFSLFLFILSFVLLLYIRFDLLNNYLFLPVQKFFYSKSIFVKEFYEKFSKYDEIKQENKELLEQNIQLNLLNSRLLEYKRENNILKKTLNFLKKRKEKFIVSNIIAKNENENIKEVFIDKGSLDGVYEGDAVIVYDGILVGKVVKVYKSYSIVRYLTDINSALAVSLENEDQTIGILEALYGLSLKIKLVPNSEKVEIGDKVISSGREKSIPRGLLVGFVDQIHYKEGDLFKELDVKTQVNYDKFLILTILHVEN